MTSNESSVTEPELKSTLLEDDWLIRSCSVYDEEYSECTSIKGRFQQYFIHGKTINCVPWKRDADNCYKWEQFKDLKAAKELIISEKQRRFERLKAHYLNTTWTKRQSPPEHWDDPLPDHMLKEYENSYLNVKSKEMKGEIEPQLDLQPPRLCNIM